MTEEISNPNKKQRRREPWWIEAVETDPQMMLSMDAWGWTQLMEAASLLNYEQCRYLVEDMQVDINCWSDHYEFHPEQPTNRNNSLFALLLNNFYHKPQEVTQICLLLLDNGINLYHTDWEGFTFLDVIDNLIRSIQHKRSMGKLYISDPDQQLQLLETLRSIVKDRM